MLFFFIKFVMNIVHPKPDEPYFKSYLIVKKIPYKYMYNTKKIKNHLFQFELKLFKFAKLHFILNKIWIHIKQTNERM